MLNSSVLDVAIGLIFVFMTVSLAASALTEALGSLTKLRQSTLRAGVQAMLNDPQFTGLALDLYNHALVNPLAQGTATSLKSLKTSPAYIDASCFALALVSSLEKKQPDRPLSDTVASITDPQLRQTLTTLLASAENDRDRFLKSVGGWFDDAMDRVSGWYKRYTQVIGFVMALGVCAALNADALSIAKVLWQRPLIATELSVKELPEAKTAIDALTSAKLLGWEGTDWDTWRARPYLPILGWLLVAAASLFGAPFWFDTLKRIVLIAGTGPGNVDPRKPAPPAA